MSSQQETELRFTAEGPRRLGDGMLERQTPKRFI